MQAISNLYTFYWDGEASMAGCSTYLGNDSGEDVRVDEMGLFSTTKKMEDMEKVIKIETKSKGLAQPDKYSGLDRPRVVGMKFWTDKGRYVWPLFLKEQRSRTC